VKEKSSSRLFARESTCLGVRTFSFGATIAALVAVVASSTEVVGWLMTARAYSVFELLRNPRHSLLTPLYRSSCPFCLPLSSVSSVILVKVYRINISALVRELLRSVSCLTWIIIRCSPSQARELRGVQISPNTLIDEPCILLASILTVTILESSNCALSGRAF